MSGLWIVAGFFLSVMAMVASAGYLVIERIARSASTAGATGLVPAPAETSVLGNTLLSLGRMFPGTARNTQASRRLLSAAGYHQTAAVTVFQGVKCATALVLGIALVFITVLVRGEVAPSVIPFIGAAAFGYLLPVRLLKHRARARQRAIHHGLATALDIWVLSLEAGQTLDQALIETSRGLRRSCPELSAELEMTFFEARASNDRTAALRNLADRTGEPETRKVVSLLLDADRFGTSIVPALRTHSKYLRLRLRQEAQAAARKVSVKLVFPVFFLIFPSVILVTLGPALIMVFTQLRTVLDGN
jgi:tight adherence protein C